MFRRQLVGFSFRRRATDDAIYRLSPERIAEVLSPTAKGIDPVAIFDAVALEKM